VEERRIQRRKTNPAAEAGSIRSRLFRWTEVQLPLLKQGLPPEKRRTGKVAARYVARSGGRPGKNAGWQPALRSERRYWNASDFVSLALHCGFIALFVSRVGAG